jgi:hypothetical protein
MGPVHHRYFCKGYWDIEGPARILPLALNLGSSLAVTKTIWPTVNCPLSVWEWGFDSSSLASPLVERYLKVSTVSKSAQLICRLN